MITLDRPSAGTVSMNYTTQNGTATAGSDYVGVNGALTFAAGETAKTVQVSLINDTLAEASESFKLVLGSLVNATSLDPVGTAIINENDANPVSSPVIRVDDITVGEDQTYAEFTVRLSAPSNNTVSVGYNQSNQAASNGNDYASLGNQVLNFAPGETVKTVRVALYDDNTAEGTESFLFNLFSPVNATVANDFARATIIDNDAPSGTPVVSVSDFVIDEQTKEAAFVITLDRPSTSTVSLNYATQDGTAQAGSDYVGLSGSLNFAAGEVTKTVKVSMINDSLAEPSESFNLVLSSLVNATSLDPVGTAIINENDANPVSSPTIRVDDITVGEDQTYAEFTVRLSAPSNNTVSVGYNQSNQTASNGNDYASLGSEVLHFAPGETVKTVRVALYDDSTAEGTENFLFNLFSPVNATVANDFARATIIDNDAPSGTPVVSVSDFVIDEQTKEAAFVITLDRPSTSTVSLNYATQDGTANAGSDYVGLGGSLNFAAGEVTKTVKVSMINDSLAEPSESFNLVLSSLVNATSLDPVGTAIINENDANPVSSPTIRVDDITVGEDQTYAEFTVRLSAPSNNTVSVGYNQSKPDGEQRQRLREPRQPGASLRAG